MDYSYEIKTAWLFGRPKPVAFFKIEKKLCCFYTLDNYSKETFNEGLVQFLSVLSKRSQIDQKLLHLDLYPSVRFCLHQLFKKEAQHPIQSAGLLFSNDLDSIKKMVDSGFSTIKIKLKKWDFQDLKWIETVANLFPYLKLRLDFNQKLNQFDPLLDIPYCNIDYLEEPIDDFKKIPIHLHSKIAIDETLRNCDMDLGLNCIYVIKPLLHPSFESIIKNLKQKNKRIIISSSFEMPIGIETLKHLIHHFELLNETHGLDTLRYYDYLPSF